MKRILFICLCLCLAFSTIAQKNNKGKNVKKQERPAVDSTALYGQQKITKDTVKSSIKRDAIPYIEESIMDTIEETEDYSLSIEELQNQVAEKDKLIDSLQNRNALVLCVYATNGVYMKFEESTINYMKEQLKIVKDNEYVKEKRPYVGQIYELLCNYNKYNDEIYNLCLELKKTGQPYVQEIKENFYIPQQKAFNYKNNCLKVLKTSEYYSKIYKKKKYSISYLDNVISILENEIKSINSVKLPNFDIILKLLK